MDVIAAANAARRVQIFLGNDPFDDQADFTLVDPTQEPESNFGRFLTVGDINGDDYDDVIVPAFRADIDGKQNAGAVYIFLGGNPFDTVADFVLVQPEVEASAQFGAAVAVGDVNNDGYGDVIVGAHLADVQGLHDAGKAFVFLGGDPFDTEADYTLTEPMPETYLESGAEFGRDIATGDINGDGYDDVMIAASWARAEGIIWAGRVQIFLGGEPFSAAADFTLIEPEPSLSQIFGWSIQSGDLNADGFDDIIVGAPRADPIPGAPYLGDSIGTEGRVQVFLGGNPFDTTVDFTLTEPTPELGARLGRDRIGIGDVNRDGYDDIVVGAPFADAEDISDAGRVQVFLGGDPFDDVADLTLTAPLPGTSADFGISAAIGDINGDGYADVIVSATGATPPGGIERAGSVFVFLVVPAQASRSKRIPDQRTPRRLQVGSARVR